MDYEKKYKNALEWARQVMNGEIGFIRKDVEKVFPELKESEDEKIRKSLIDMLKNDEKCYLKEIAWLEKQGNLMKALQISNSRIEELVEEKYNLEEKLKKQSEQKPVIIIPKFRVGDEIKAANEEPLTITKINEKGYWSEDLFICGFDEECIWDLVEQKPTIEMITPEESLGIDSETYNKIVDECIYGDDKSTWGKQGEQKPYGQRQECVDCQFNYAGECKGSCAMKRGEQKPVWSEENEENFKHLMDEIVCLGNSRNSANRLYYDRLIKFIEELKNRAQPKEKWCNKDERMLDRLIAYFEKQVAFTDDDNPRYANWLKSLKDRVLSQPKQEWSEEDEEIRSALIKYLGSSDTLSVDLASAIYWLKSLRPKSNQEVDEQIETIAMHLDNCGDTAMAEILRSCNLRPQNTWKPSDAQMASITCAVRKMKESACYDSELVSLFNDLKKLREG